MSDAAEFALATGLLYAFLVAWPRLCATVLARIETSQDRRARVVTGVGLVSCGAAVVGPFVSVAAFDPVLLVLGPDASPGIVAVASALVLTVLVLAGLWLARSGHRPLAAIVRPEEYRDPPALKRRFWIARAGAVTTVALVSQLIAFDVIGLGARWILVVGIVVWFGGYVPATLPLRIATGSVYRLAPPTDDERERIAAAYRRVGRDPGQILVHPQSGVQDVSVAGTGATKRVVVARPFMDEASDDALAVALAQADERALGRFTEVFFVGLALGALAGVGLLEALVAIGDPAWGVGLCLAAAAGALVALRRARRITRRADDFAVARLGSECVGAVYREWLPAFTPGRGRAPTSRFGRWLVALLSPVPRAEERIGRLGDG